MVLPMLQPLNIESVGQTLPEALAKRIMLVERYLFPNWKKSNYAFSLQYDERKTKSGINFVPVLTIGLAGAGDSLTASTLDDLFQAMKLHLCLFNQFINDVSVYVLADIFEEDVQVVHKLINVSKAS